MKAVSIGLFAAMSFFAHASMANEKTYVLTGAPEKSAVDLVAHYALTQNQKAFLARLSSASDKIHYQSLFSSIKKMRGTALMSGAVTTFRSADGKMNQIVALSPRLFLVDGKMVSIADDVKGPVALGRVLAKAMTPAKPGKTSAFLTLALEVALADDAAQLVFLQTGTLSVPVADRRMPEYVRPSLSSEATYVVDEGKMNCGAKESTVESPALSRFGNMKAKLVAGENTVAFTNGSEYQIRVKLNRVSSEVGLKKSFEECVGAYIRSYTKPMTTEAAESQCESVRKEMGKSPVFINADSLDQVRNHAQICDAGGANCKPLTHDKLAELWKPIKLTPEQQKRERGPAHFTPAELKAMEAEKEAACKPVGETESGAAANDRKKKCLNISSTLNYSKGRLDSETERARWALAGTVQALAIGEVLCKDSEFRAAMARGHSLNMVPSGAAPARQ